MNCKHGLRIKECAFCRTSFRPQTIFGLKDQLPLHAEDDPRSLFDDWDYGEAGIGVLEHSAQMSGLDRLISESCHKGSERVNRLEPSETLKIDRTEAYRPLPYFKDAEMVARFAKIGVGMAARLVWAFNSLQLRDDDRKKICLDIRVRPTMLEDVFALAKDLEETCVIPPIPLAIVDEPDDRTEYELRSDSLETEPDNDASISAESGNELRAIPIGESDSTFDWIAHHSKRNPSFEVWFKGLQVLASRSRADALTKRFRALFNGQFAGRFPGKELDVLSSMCKTMFDKVEHKSQSRFNRLMKWISTTQVKNARFQLVQLQKSGRVQFTGHRNGQWSKLWAAMNARFPKKEKRPEPPLQTSFQF